MAYDGAYLQQVSDRTGKNGAAVWLLRTTDAQATFTASEYISDATKRGMLFGDLVIMQRVTTGTLDAPTAIGTEDFYLSAVSAAGAGTMAARVAIS